MVASKRIQCAFCQKKCSGNVLRYQDHYYHKQCFEQEQNELATAAPGTSKTLDHYLDRASTTGSHQDQATTDSLHHRSVESIEHHHQATKFANNDSANGDAGQRDSTSSKYLHTSSKHCLSSSIALDQAVDNSSESQRFATSTLSSRQNLSTPREHQTTLLPMERNKSASSPSKGQTLDNGQSKQHQQSTNQANRAATLPHSTSVPANGFITNSQSSSNIRQQQLTNCAGCSDKIRDGQALIALDLHWHVWCFKCTECKTPLHGEYVAKDGKAYCERDYQKLFGITCVYCKRYITGKVLQAGEAHHFHPSCARCSKCGDPFVPGEEMYLQGEVTWHPRCGPGPEGSMISPGDEYDESIRSQYGRSSPAYADSEAVGDLSRIYTISYLNADPNQGYLRRPIEPNPAKSPQFSRPTSSSRLAAGDRSRCSSRSNQYNSRERSVPRGMYSVLSSMRSGSSSRARSPSMMNEEAVHLAHYPSGQKPNPDSVPTIERDDFPAPPFPYPDSRHRTRAATPTSRSSTGAQQPYDEKSPDGVCKEQQVEQQQHHRQQHQRSSRPRSREIALDTNSDSDGDSLSLNEEDPQFRKEEEELSKIANGIGKIFLQTLKEREKLRAWKRANLDPRNASRTPSATRELPSRLRYENPTNASPSRDLDRPRPWEEDELTTGGEQSPTRTRSSLGRPPPSQVSSAATAANSSSYGYKVIQSNRSTPRPGYGLTPGPYARQDQISNGLGSEVSFAEQQRLAQNSSADLLGKSAATPAGGYILNSEFGRPTARSTLRNSAHLHRSMPNVANLHHVHNDGPPKLYPYHLLATSNYRLPPDVDRCHLERHLSNEEFQYIFHCDRLDFYRLPEWKRNELKRRAKLF